MSAPIYIDQEQILEATNRGLDIILHFYPEAEASQRDKKRLFKLGPEDKNASGQLSFYENVWLVKDFGGDSKARTAIGITMVERNCDFKTALQWIAAKWNIKPGAKAEGPKPDFKERKAKENDIEGIGNFIERELTVADCKLILAPKVWEKLVFDKKSEAAAMAHCAEVFNQYHFRPLVSYESPKKDEPGTILARIATEAYPMFYFQHETWQKVYQPKAEKFRFIYAGKKPADFLHGHTQLHDAYRILSKDYERELAKWKADKQAAEEEKEKFTDKEPKAPKLPHAFLVSGGSDALNLAVLGYLPLWSNSETDNIPNATFRDLHSKCTRIYNVPDIDKTGLQQAHKRALAQVEMFNIYLPELIAEKGGKDLRDYFRHFSPFDFSELLRIAYPYKFWYSTISKGVERIHIRNRWLYNFLYRSGFSRFEIETEKRGWIYVQVEGNIVREADETKMKMFAYSWLESQRVTVEVMDAFDKCNSLSFDKLPVRKIDFEDNDAHTQFMFFKNKTVKVTGSGITFYKAGEIEKFVWEREVIPHTISQLPPMFAVTQNEQERWVVEVKNKSCLLLRYLINTCRIHWREELEARVEGLPESEFARFQNLGFSEKDMLKLKGLPKEEWEQYREKNRWEIAGELLTEEEQLEQQHHLASRFFAGGYHLHRFRDGARGWATWNMDAKLSANDEAHGGSGKTLFFTFLSRLLNNKYFDGRDVRLPEKQHLFEGVTEHTDLMFVNDCTQYFDLGRFIGCIDGPIGVNPKHSREYTVPAKLAPKLAFTSNYGLLKADPTTLRRLIFNLYSDYYHFNKDGEYREERRVYDDFGKLIGDEFTEEEWNLSLNLCIQFLQFYLSLENSVKISAPIARVNERNLKADMGDDFLAWAEVFFDPKGTNVNKNVLRTAIVEDFNAYLGKKQELKPKTFLNKIKAFCRYKGYHFNPADQCNTSDKKRIINEFSGKSCEFFHIAVNETFISKPTGKVDDLPF